MKSLDKNIKEIKTGVIGIGSMGFHHARIFSEISNLVGVSDLNIGLGKEVSEKFGTSFFDNYTDLLERVDAVSIVVPTKFHESVALSAAKNKVNMLVEKPFAFSLNQCQNIIDVCNKNKVILSVGHIERHNPPVKVLNDILNSKQVGNINSINFTRLSPYPTRITDVGVIFDLTIHDIDLMHYLSNSKIKDFYCVGQEGFKQNLEESIFASAILENNSLVTFHTSWLAKDKVRKIDVSCDHLWLSADLIGQKLYVRSNNQNLDLSTLDFLKGYALIQDQILVTKEEPLLRELNDFLESIISHKSPLVKGEDGMIAVEVASKFKDFLNI